MIPAPNPAPNNAQPEAQIAPGQPAPQGAAPAGNQEYLGFIKELHDLLLLRIEAAGQKNPNFGQAIDTGISPEAAQEMFQILPEIKVIFDAIDAAERGGGAAPIQQGQPQAQPAPQTDNPLIRNDQMGGVSRGLVG